MTAITRAVSSVSSSSTGLASPVPSPTATFVKAEEGLYGTPIRGGDSFDKTVPIPIGKLFHLDHSQQAGHYDFFTIPAHSGQSIVVTMKSGPSGFLAIGLNDPTRKEVARKNLVRNERVTDHVQADVADQQNGTYYMLVGNDEWPSEMDGTFQVDLVDNSDANSGRDAGSSDGRALEIHPGTYPRNYMSESDSMDVFKFKAEAERPISSKPGQLRPTGVST